MNVPHNSKKKFSKNLDASFSSLIRQLEDAQQGLSFETSEESEDVTCPQCDTVYPKEQEHCPNCGATNMRDHSIQMFDAFVVDGVRRTSDGYLTCNARVARTGIQTYKGSELGRPDLGEVRVYRPPSEVFSKDAMHSMAHRPITLNHPSEQVNAANWKKYAIGHTGDEVVRDGDVIRVPMVVMDAAAIDAIESGKAKELSVGYTTDLKWKKGTTDKGETYDAMQTAIRGNHLAVVPVARGGDKLRVGDDDSVQEIDPDSLHYLRVMTHHKSAPVVKKLAAADLKSLLTTNYGDAIGTAKYDEYCAGLDLDDAAVDDRGFSEEDRKKLAKSGAALPGGGFPIKTVEDLKNAVRAIGRAKDPAAAKAHIISRAKSLGATKELPADWVKSKTSDAQEQGEKTMSAIVTIDGSPIEVADELSASVIRKQIATLIADKADLKGKLDKAAADKEEEDEEKVRGKKAVDAKDGEIAALKKQLVDAQAGATPAILDKLVKDRLAVIDRASKILDKAFSFDGKSNSDIARAAVAKHYGDSFVKDKSDDYVAPLFDAIDVKDGDKGRNTGHRNLGRAIGDAARRHGNSSGDSSVDVRDAAFADMEKDLNNAWRRPHAAGGGDGK
jgi:hypothetical protein